MTSISALLNSLEALEQSLLKNAALMDKMSEYLPECVQHARELRVAAGCVNRWIEGITQETALDTGDGME